jgi:exodeoxyribonuclease VII large subunit
MLNKNVSIISVSQLNNYLKRIIDDNSILNNVLVKGEISNLKYHPSGHIYFSLKDNESVIKCVMFSSYTGNLNFKLNEGDKVIVNGALSVYVQGGTYQIYVKNMEKDGIGNLYLEFERLKKKLEEEGLFSPYLKKQLPKYPFKIGVATSSSGAALRDIVSTIKRRWPLASVIVFPCLVQGDGASESIINALESSKQYALDVMIIGRGGGSIEDLWCFNSESLAYYIHEYPVPIISAVGHEVDFTICDFVCDVRAATPTAAAELATPDINEIIDSLEKYKIDLNKNISNVITNNRMYISTLSSVFNKDSLLNLINRNKELVRNQMLVINNFASSLYKDNKFIINEETNKLKNAFKDYKSKKINELTNLISALDNLSPLKVMLRGYSVVKTSEKTINSIKDVKLDDVVQVRVSHGKFYADVTKKEEK